MAMMHRIALYLVRIPLIKPYRLSLGAVTHYDMIVVEITDGDGNIGLGEANVVTGYTDETLADAWQAAQAFAAQVRTQALAAAKAATLAFGVRYPFTACAFGTAIEMLEHSPRLRIEQATPVPLLALLDAPDEAAMAREVDTLLAAGYRTFKIKVGFDAARDAHHVRLAQRVVAGRAQIRIDANQGYSAEQGIAFVRALTPEGIELFEQPCAAGDWDAQLALARASSLPLMLDESIYGLADIERAAELQAAAYIKVKLMKLVTLDALAAAIERIRALGMKPVLGNGVACDLGCWLEACVARTHIDNAGEMNGFLKPRANLLTEALEFRDGALWLQPGYRPRLDHARLAPYIEKQKIV